jgi:hypothetical protein
MRVDQPRHQGPTADVDHIALGRPSYATLRDLLDEPVGDQHLGATPQFRPFAVEQRAVREKDRAHLVRALV